MKNNIYFCTFANTSLKPSLRRIKNESKSLRIFKKIFTFTEHNLTFHEQKEIKKIINITGTQKGYGYWAWKPWIIKKTLSRIPYNSILIYCDAGCELNKNGLCKLHKYIELANKYQIVCTQLTPPYTDENWTKKDTLNLFENYVKDAELKSGQLQGGTLLLKKTPLVESIMAEWVELMSLENLHFFDDTPSLAQNNIGFVENRHDQSLFSLLLKKHKQYFALPVGNFYAETIDDWKKLEKTEPILQKRLKQYKKQISIKGVIVQILKKLNIINI